MLPNLFFCLSTHYTLCIVMIGTTLIGMTAGMLGTFALLRRQSLLGDALSHAALPGIALTFLFTSSKNPSTLLIGGALTGMLGTALTMLIIRITLLKLDAILGIVLSVFFGGGLVLMTHIQKKPDAEQAILNKFIFGNASTLLLHDIYVITAISVLVICCLFLFWKEFMMVSFDESFTQAAGYPVLIVDCLLTGLLVLTVCVGLQTIGVILMSTMLIAPAAAARQWAHRLSSVVLLAGFLGACTAVMGSWLSHKYDHLPTGPVIVILLSICVAISLLCAPKRNCL